MQTLVLHNKQAILKTVPDPVPEQGWVVAKIMATTICGSDKNAYHSCCPVCDAGHEGTGVVVDTDKSSLLKVGDRVVLNPLSGCGACDQCLTGNYIYCMNKPPFTSHFAQYVKIQDFVCSKLPDDISFEIGTLAGCALSPAFSSLKRLQVSAFDVVLVIGLGPVGLGAVTVAKFRGARVIGVEYNPYRQKLALELGADLILDPTDPDLAQKVAAFTKPGYLRKALDTSGNPQAERLAIDLVGPGGMVAFIGENHSEIPIIPSRDFIRKGLTLLGSWHYNLNDKEEMMTILRLSKVAPKIITHEFGFTQVQEAFDTFITGNTGKVLLKPWE